MTASYAGRVTRVGMVALVALITVGPGSAWAQSDGTPEPDPEEEPEGFTPPAGTDAVPAFIWSGYVDVGFANAQGDGTSYPVNDQRLPVDYGVDAFAPAVNSRGDVASNDPRGRFANGFLPRSVNIGGRPSFLLNVLSLDLRYMPSNAPLMAFARVQMLPRFGGRGRGNETVVNVDQAFGRVTPFSSHELHLSLGKFDSVFGIEYLDNASPFRTGITPSLMARYTTGTTLGARAFFRQQVAPLWSAFSLNIAASNGGNFVEALQPPDASLTGRPVLSGRFGYELNLPHLQVKLGASGLHGPRNDQGDENAILRMWGFDGRLYLFGLALAGEYINVDEDEGAIPKQTGMGEFPISSQFQARGYWAQLGYGVSAGLGPLRVVTPYGRFEQRKASFGGFRPLRVRRVTVGLRVDLWERLIVKAELLLNEEAAGAPQVDNNVFACSAVFSW